MLFRSWIIRKTLNRPFAWNDLGSYLRGLRLTSRFELPAEIGLLLQVEHDCEPTFVGADFISYYLGLLVEHYSDSVPHHPEQVDRLVDICRENAIHEIANDAIQMPRGVRARGNNNAWNVQTDWSRVSIRYERVLASAFWQAIQKGDQDKAERLLVRAHQLYPEQINTLIDVIPWIRDRFGEEKIGRAHV